MRENYRIRDKYPNHRVGRSCCNYICYSKKVSSSVLQSFIGEKAQDFLAFKSDLLSEQAGEDPIKKTELVRSLVETISCIPDPIQRSIYVQTIATRLQLQEKLLHSEVTKEVAKTIAKENKSRSGRPMPQEPAHLVPPPFFQETPQGAPKRLRTQRNLLEDNLVRLLLEHGESMVTIETQTEEESEEVEVTFAELLVHRVETQEIQMEDPSTDFILSKFKTSLDVGEIPSTETFFTDTTEEVQKRAANMLVSKYNLSDNWEDKHHVFSVKEEDILEKALSSATIRILLHDVQRNIDDILEKLDESGISEEDQNHLIREKIVLDKQVMELNSSLGVVILPK